jgi:cobalt-zinc-cadmium efflux system protein
VEQITLDARRLRLTLLITLAYFITELAGAYFTNSLALFSDAIHLLTDLGAIALSLFTLWIANRPAGAGKTFGYLRAEILGAVANGLFLWLLVAFLFVGAVSRLRNPEPVKGLGMMAIAAVGIIVNSLSAWITFEGHTEGGRGMALRAVFLHVISDLAGSVGVLIAGALIYFTQWHLADSLVSMVIGLLILFSSWGLIREGVDILMEAVPANLSLEELHRGLLSVDGTQEVHDLHVWCLTAREYALSAHAVVTQNADSDRVLSDMSDVLERFNIHHMTVQLERATRRKHEPDF